MDRKWQKQFAKWKYKKLIKIANAQHNYNKKKYIYKKRIYKMYKYYNTI